jgi:hypothetical protein
MKALLVKENVNELLSISLIYLDPGIIDKLLCLEKFLHIIFVDAII